MSTTTVPPSPTSPSTPATVRGAQQGLSPERLDRVISTTSPRGWIALVATIMLLLAAFAWSILATIPRQTVVNGVVSSLAYTEVITANAEGMFNLNVVLNGSVVKEGDPIGTITRYDGGVASVTAPVTGELTSIRQNNGTGVGPGDALGIIQIAPDPAEGVVVVTYVSASEAMTFTPGQTAEVSVTNLAQSVTTNAKATVLTVSSTPSRTDSISVQTTSDVTTQQLEAQAGGSPYRVELKIETTETVPANLVPQAGELVEIVNTFGTIHPIQLLFGAK